MGASKFKGVTETCHPRVRGFCASTPWHHQRYPQLISLSTKLTPTMALAFLETPLGGRQGEYFLDLSQWGDNRNNKVSVRQNDLQRLAREKSKGMYSAKASTGKVPSNFEEQINPSKAWEMRNNTGWELLSLEELLTSLERTSQLPSVENFVCILQNCRKGKNLRYAKRLHAYMCKSGLEAHKSLGNYVIPMLVDCGSMCDALQVFNRLVDPNEYSWTSLIMGHTNCGESEHALNLYQKMQVDCVHPSEYTAVALLKACARLKDAEKGRDIHVEIASKGLERDPFVGSTLVDMYAKCGLLAKARGVFDKLPVRDVVSWNALISGHVEHGLVEEALNCFQQMQVEGVSPDVATFVYSLKACGSSGDIDKGQKMHIEIARKGLEKNLFVGNTLIDMYAKYGSLAKAREVLDKLPVCDVVSWNALIGGYTEHGLGQNALDCFENMRVDGVSPDAVTFICSLKACSNTAAIDKGREIHAEISRKGLERDPLVGGILVDMYAKCGLLAKAREVFDELRVRDVVSWTALIAGYAEHQLGEEALDCFEQMQFEDVSPDAVTFVCSLKACGNTGAIDKGQEIHAEIARKRLERDPFVNSILVDMYAKCCSLGEAQEVFDKLPIRDVVLWSTLIAVYADNELGQEALNCFEQMRLEGVAPDSVTFLCSLKACGSTGAIDKGNEIHTDIARKGLESDPFIGNTLVYMYSKCGSFAKSLEVFDKISVRDVVSWSALVAGYVEWGLSEEALNCFQRMQSEGVSPDAVTFACGLKASGCTGAIDKGQEIHIEIARMGLEGDLTVGNALVNMYGKCGSLAKAQEVFDNLTVQDRVSWSGLIAGYADHGLVEEALHCFEQMQLEGVSSDVVSWSALISAYAQLGESEIVFQMMERMKGEGIKPNGITFLSVLTMCSHAGLVHKGRRYFEAMCIDYGITPTIKHYICMVDLLCRAGQLDESVAMVEKISLQPVLALWHTVLDACRKWGNIELGRQAFEHAVRLDEKDSAAYVLMSNIYAAVNIESEKMTMETVRLDLD